MDYSRCPKVGPLLQVNSYAFLTITVILAVADEDLAFSRFTNELCDPEMTAEQGTVALPCQ